MRKTYISPWKPRIAKQNLFLLRFGRRESSVDLVTGILAAFGTRNELKRLECEDRDLGKILEFRSLWYNKSGWETENNSLVLLANLSDNNIEKVVATTLSVIGLLKLLTFRYRFGRYLMHGFRPRRLVYCICK